ncbi:hypothetical protein BDV23DRAFT_45990 [Aspergillus alliaceus]|uniref:Uncharacterized protein n=1 Tax=Petromyces alliaceus TaxID=209559 RepID=A0A5N7CPL3_PETAA|nr:hypothetical protein BDV23DRAFT_45990 [Aspergillus alliaceus]
MQNPAILRSGLNLELYTPPLIDNLYHFVSKCLSIFLSKRVQVIGVHLESLFLIFLCDIGQKSSSGDITCMITPSSTLQSSCFCDAFSDSVQPQHASADLCWLAGNSKAHSTQDGARSGPVSRLHTRDFHGYLQTSVFSLVYT